MDYALFATAQILSSAGVQFAANASTLKLTLEVQGWVCASMANTLDIILYFEGTPSFTSLEGPFAGDDDKVDTFILSSPYMSSILRLLKYGEADGFNVSVASSFLAATDQLLLQFPCFRSSFLYDPDVSVVLVPPDGGDGDTRYLPLISLLVIPLSLILVTAVVVAVLSVWRWRILRRRPSAVNL